MLMISSQIMGNATASGSIASTVSGLKAFRLAFGCPWSPRTTITLGSGGPAKAPVKLTSSLEGCILGVAGMANCYVIVICRRSRPLGHA